MVFFCVMIEFCDLDVFALWGSPGGRILNYVWGREG